MESLAEVVRGAAGRMVDEALADAFAFVGVPIFAVDGVEEGVLEVGEVCRGRTRRHLGVVELEPRSFAVDGEVVGVEHDGVVDAEVGVLDLFGNQAGMAAIHPFGGMYDIPVGVTTTSRWADVVTVLVTSLELAVVATVTQYGRGHLLQTPLFTRVVESLPL